MSYAPTVRKVINNSNFPAIIDQRVDAIPANNLAPDPQIGFPHVA
jgi:hypothetical protein